MAGKDCPSCLGCAGTLHHCTPGFPGDLAGQYRIKNNDALRECLGLFGKPVFSAAEIESGYACRHAVDAAEAQYEQLNGRKRETRGPGRPRQDACLGPAPADAGSACRFCTCPLLLHRLKARANTADKNTSRAAATAAARPWATS